MILRPSLIDALDDPDLFAGMFDAPSWRPWRAFLGALQGLPLSEDHLAIYRRHTGRSDPPTRAARYAELVVGRRGGKSRILALIATYLACVLDHAPYLVPGEVAVVAVIAKDRQQARVIMGYIKGFLREIPLFAELIEDELAETIRLSNNVVIEVHTASIGAPRGRTFLAVLCDETAFWPTGDTSANPDIEVINAVRPGLSTIPYSLLLIASSPYAKRGILYTNYARYFGKDDAPVLVWRGTTEEMNSSMIGDEQIAEMYATDPERASAEYGALFRSDLEVFVSREAIEAAVARGVTVRPALSGVNYTAFCDPSGGSSDSMTLHVVHREGVGARLVSDCIVERRAPFSPDGVVSEFAETLKPYRVSTVYADKYGAEWVRERFKVHGIGVEPAELTRSEIYLAFLPLLNSGRVDLLDNARMVAQFVGLERRTARSGKDSVDHAQGQHDDVANAVAGALVQAAARPGPMVIDDNLMAWASTRAHSRFDYSRY